MIFTSVANRKANEPNARTSATTIIHAPEDTRRCYPRTNTHKRCGPASAWGQLARSTLCVPTTSPGWPATLSLDTYRKALCEALACQPGDLLSWGEPEYNAFIDLVFAVDDPRSEDVRALLVQHLAFAREVTPPAHVHALDVDGLLDPAVTLFSVRRRGALLGVGALRELDPSHGEVKSMHVASAARGQSIGRALLDHLLSVAAGRGYRFVSLETGTMDAFAPARSLYESAGFTRCEPFGDYTTNPHSACMRIDLERRVRPPGQR